MYKINNRYNIQVKAFEYTIKDKKKNILVHGYIKLPYNTIGIEVRKAIMKLYPKYFN